jgi:hypothetical protein
MRGADPGVHCVIIKRYGAAICCIVHVLSAIGNDIGLFVTETRDARNYIGNGMVKVNLHVFLLCIRERERPQSQIPKINLFWPLFSQIPETIHIFYFFVHYPIG